MRTVDRAEAEAKVRAWFDRHKPSRPAKGDDHTSSVTSANVQTPRPDTPDGTVQSTQPEDSGNPTVTDPPEDSDQPIATDPPETPGTPIAQLQKRLGLIMPAKRSK